MRKRSTNSNPVTLKIWKTIPEWTIEQINKELYAAKIENSTTIYNSKKLFEDKNIALNAYFTEGNHILGYTIQAKKKFLTNNRTWHILLVNEESKEHHSPEDVFEDKNVKLTKFNKTRNCSYWFALRYRNEKKDNEKV
jgi:hypothetical protein